jgi:hypothetical protein
MRVYVTWLDGSETIYETVEDINWSDVGLTLFFDNGDYCDVTRENVRHIYVEK